MKIACLTMEQYDNRRENSVGSSRIRARWVMKYTPEIEQFKNGAKYDAVIFQKAYWREYMEQFKGVKIFDLCDPDWLDGRPVVGVIDRVDAVTVPTKALAEYLRTMTDKPVVVIPDRIDPDAHYPTKEIHVGRIKTAVWFGYSNNAVVLQQAKNVLWARGIKIIAISDRNAGLDCDVFVKYNQETIYEELIKHDVVLLPSYDKSVRFKYKSNNKTLTSWALKMPVVREVPDLDRLNDPDVRKKEAEEKYKMVIDKYHVKKSGVQYLKLINQLLKEKGVRKRAKQKEVKPKKG